MSKFEPLDPPRYNYVDVKCKPAKEDVSVYIKAMEDKIKKAMDALDQGKSAHEVAMILQG